MTGRVRRGTHQAAVDAFDQSDTGDGVIDIRVGQGPGDNYSRTIDGQMELPLDPRAASSMFRSCPLPPPNN